MKVKLYIYIIRTAKYLGNINKITVTIQPTNILLNQQFVYL